MNIPDVTTIDLELAISIINLEKKSIEFAIHQDALTQFLMHKKIIDKDEYTAFHVQYVAEQMKSKDMQEIFSNLDATIKEYKEHIALLQYEPKFDFNPSEEELEEMIKTLSHDKLEE